MKASLLLSTIFILSFSIQAQVPKSSPIGGVIAMMTLKWVESRMKEPCSRDVSGAAANLLMDKNPKSLYALYQKDGACESQVIDENCLKAADGIFKVYLKDQKGYKALAAACEHGLSTVPINIAFMQHYGESVYSNDEKIESPPIADDAKQEKIYDAGISCEFKKMKFENKDGKGTCVEEFDCAKYKGKKFKFGELTLDSGTYKLRCAANNDAINCEETSLGSCKPVSYQRKGMTFSRDGKEIPATNSGR